MSTLQIIALTILGVFVVGPWLFFAVLSIWSPPDNGPDYHGNTDVNKLMWDSSTFGKWWNRIVGFALLIFIGYSFWKLFNTPFGGGS